MKGGRNRKGEGQKGGNREMREGEGMKVEGEDRSCFHKVTSSTKYSTAVAVSTRGGRFFAKTSGVSEQKYFFFQSKPNTNVGVFETFSRSRKPNLVIF